MKVLVNEQSQRFYLATNKWEPVVGHEIKVGVYRFCAIPLDDCINISEVTSGAKISNIPMSLEVMSVTESKEEAMEFFKKVGEQLKNVIGRTSDFDERLSEMQKTAFERLGKMPPIEDIDTEWVLADASELLH